MVRAAGSAVYDAALYLNGTGSFPLKTLDGLWSLLAGAGPGGLRAALASLLGRFGDSIAELPAVVVMFVLGVLLAWIGQRAGAIGK